MKTTHIDNSAKIRKFTNQMFPGYSFRAFIQRHRPIICPFEPLIEAVPPGSRVLDIGCGAGLMLGLLSLSNRIKKGIGFDTNPAAIKSATKMSHHLNLESRISFKHIKANQPWPSGDFDTISMIDVMHHIPPINRKECLRKVAETLPTGGTFVYKDMNGSSFWFRWGNRIHDLLLAREWISYMPRKEVISICQELGLKVVQKKFWSYFWYGHELTIFKKG